MGKRKPLLADEFLHRKPVTDLFNRAEMRRFDAMRDHLREAKLFVLDEQAAGYAAEFIRDHPAAIAHDQEFAIPPFPRMYVELPYSKFLRTVNKANELLLDSKYDDTEVGYFFDGPTVYVLSRMRDDPPTDAASMVMPICYRLNKPFTLKEELAVCDDLGISRIGIDLLYWGSSYPLTLDSEAAANDIKNITHPERVLKPHTKILWEMSALREHHSFEPWYATDVVTRRDMLAPLIKSAAGDLRNIIAMVLFLNRTSEVRFDDTMPPHKGWIGPRPAMFLKHNIVRVKLDPKQRFIKTYGGHGAWRRRHDVKGHYCHDKVARAQGTGHNMIPWIPTSSTHEPQWVEYDVNRWRCMVCGGRRWHRHACSRGSKDKGSVVKTYEVTK